MAQAFNDKDELVREARGKDLYEAFGKLQEKIKKEDKVTKIVVKKLTLEERVEQLELQVSLLLQKNTRLK
jgi:hypothetical protein